MADPHLDALDKDTRGRVEEFRRRPRTSLLTLLFTDLVGSTKLKQDRGDTEAVALMQAHAAVVREILSGFAEAEEISTAGDAFFCIFLRPSDAVVFALRLQARTREEFTRPGVAPATHSNCASATHSGGLSVRIGIHLGEVIIEESPGAAKPRDLFGLQVDAGARGQSLADGGQVLLTRSVFDNARQVLKGRDLGVRRGSDARSGSDVGVRRGSDAQCDDAAPHRPGASAFAKAAADAQDGSAATSCDVSDRSRTGGTPVLQPLVRLNHGPYLLKGLDDPIEVCEVGEEGLAPLRAPGPSEKARPADMSEEELGWRPAPETKVPGTAWMLVEKLGEGGFGEVWRARHPQMKETRVFKFCFMKDRLRTLRRELAIFHLLRGKVGDHPNIVKLHDVFLDSGPYDLSMEDVPGRNLREWLEGNGESVSSSSVSASAVSVQSKVQNLTRLCHPEEPPSVPAATSDLFAQKLLPVHITCSRRPRERRFE